MDRFGPEGSESSAVSEVKKSAYETPRLESYGDASAIIRSLDVQKVDDVDIAGQGSFVLPP